MKILYVIPSLNLAGAEVLVAKMAIIAKKNKLDIAILIFKKVPSHLTKMLDDVGVEIIASSSNKVYSPLNILFILRYLKSHSCDIIHAHLTPAQLWVAVVSLLMKMPLLITTEHNTYNRRRKILFKPLDIFIYSRFEKIVSISRGTEKAFLKWLPNIANKSVVINNGIDLQEFNNVQFSGKLSSDSLAVLCIGRFEEQKDHETLIRAFALTTGMVLFLIGDGQLKERIEQLVVNLGIDKKVNFLGKRSDIANIIKMADIYVQSSKWEGFGIAVLEAMAGGLPIIASKVDGLKDIVADAGLFFKPGNIKDLAYKLTLLANDEGLRCHLSMVGIKRARYFSLSETFEKYYQLYNSLLLE